MSFVTVAVESANAEVDRLRAEAAAGLADQRGGPQLRIEPGERLFVARVGEVVAGFATLRLSDPAVITELLVDPPLRRVGVGQALLEACIDAARAAGCSGIDSVALPGDRDTKNFFETFGLTARLITVHRRL